MSKKTEHLRDLYKNVKPPAELNERVISRVHELRARDASPERVLSRRAILVGAAGCAAIAGLAIGSALLPGGPTAGNAFGLAIAQADEVQGMVRVSAGPDGLMPYENSVGNTINLKLNLSAQGSNIETVTYRIEGSPRYSIEVLGSHDPGVSYPAVTLAFGSEPHSPTDSSLSEPYFHVFDVETITVNYVERTGSNDYQPDGGAYHYVRVTYGDLIWESDPTLQLMHTWLQLSALPSDEVAEERETARQAFVDAYDELAADKATFYEWLRGVYVSSFELAASQLAKARLVADVTFADGSTTSCSYRIDLVESHDQVLLDRFDALCELDDNAGVEEARAEYVPWVSLPIPTDEQVAADPRLSEPIFTIEDVTQS